MSTELISGDTQTTELIRIILYNNITHIMNNINIHSFTTPFYLNLKLISTPQNGSESEDLTATARADT